MILDIVHPSGLRRNFRERHVLTLMLEQLEIKCSLAELGFRNVKVCNRKRPCGKIKGSKIPVIISKTFIKQSTLEYLTAYLGMLRTRGKNLKIFF